MKVSLKETKKQTQKIGFIAIFAILLIGIAIFAGITYHRSQLYEQAITDVCENDFDSAEQCLSELPESYQQSKTLSNYITIHEEYKPSDYKAASSTLEQLKSLDDFEDSRLLAAYNTFQRTVIAADEKYKRDSKAADTVEEQIDSIGTVTINSEQTIQNASNAYAALNEDAKKLVENKSVLQDASSTLEQIKKATAVSKQIKQIGEVTLDSESKINTAYQQYQELSAEEKEYVENIDTLTNAQNKLSELKEQKRQKEAEQRAAEEASASSASVESGRQYYWVPRGEVYHITPNCPTLRRSKHIYNGSTPPEGRRKCKVCP